MSGTGRRSAVGRRLDVTVVLSVLLPALLVLSALLLRPEVPPRGTAAPEETPLTSATVICPGGPEGVLVASGSGERGDVQVRQGERVGEVRVAPDRPSEVDTGTGPVVVRAEGTLAPGLLAGRFAGSAARECRPPAYDEWFTGVGAGAEHTSVLELTNPDAGPAVVDVTVHGRRGVVEATDLRGIAVPGHGTVRFDLARTVPRRDELALHVVVNRGRASASVLDRFDPIGRGPRTEDHLPAQAEPSRDNLLLGLPAGPGPRVLLLANPGEVETRAAIRLVTPESVFEAVDTEEVVVPPGGVQRVPVARILRGGTAKDALGLLVESGEPVTATLRSLAGGDLTTTVPGIPVAEPTEVLVPTGEKELLLGGARAEGEVTVVARDARGKVLAEERVPVAPDRGQQLELPEEAVLVAVDPGGVAVSGAVLASGDGGATVLRLRPLERSGLVADVRPGLPGD